MALIDVAELAPVQRLLAIAQGDTGQSRTVAAFLLAWWNAQASGGFDLADLWSVDEAIARDMVATVAFVASHREYPTAFGLGPQFEALVTRWRPALAQGDGHG